MCIEDWALGQTMRLQRTEITVTGGGVIDVGALPADPTRVAIEYIFAGTATGTIRLHPPGAVLVTEAVTPFGPQSLFDLAHFGNAVRGAWGVSSATLGGTVIIWTQQVPAEVITKVIAHAQKVYGI